MVIQILTNDSFLYPRLDWYDSNGPALDELRLTDHLPAVVLPACHIVHPSHSVPHPDTTVIADVSDSRMAPGKARVGVAADDRDILRHTNSLVEQELFLAKPGGQCRALKVGMAMVVFASLVVSSMLVLVASVAFLVALSVALAVTRPVARPRSRRAARDVCMLGRFRRD